MADSWEEVADAAAPAPKPKLNPTAAAFSFNPTAGSFVPGGSFVPAAAPPAPPSAQLAAVSLGGDGGAAAAAAAEAEARARAEAEAKAKAKAEAEAKAKAEAEAKAAAEAQAKAQAEAEAEAKAKAESEAAAAAAAAAAKAKASSASAAGPSDAERAESVRKTLAELQAADPRDHLNVVFIGHVDAGKSTLAGQILLLTGGVDERTIEKYEREAKEKNREGWYMAYVMDTSEEERLRGKTVEVGRACFGTDKRRYTVLDAPGHKGYVPNMISGAAQADVGVLVISARKGEFETGFERGGQTREHVLLAKTLGVSKLVVVVNKMDDSTVVHPDGEWPKERYDEIVSKLQPFIKGSGYNLKTDVTFLPIAALPGKNVRDPPTPKECPWLEGHPLFYVLDRLEAPPRDPLAPFRMPIFDRYKDLGTVLMGRSEAGLVKKGDTLTVSPQHATVKVAAIWRDDEEVDAAGPGENLRVRVTGVEEDDVSPGFVLSSVRHPVPEVTSFEAQIVVLELLEHKPILSSGYKAILHLHTVTEECEIAKIVAAIDPKTKEKKKVKYVKKGAIIIARVSLPRSECVETFDACPQLGRFTLRDEGKTIAIGKVTKLPRSARGE